MSPEALQRIGLAVASERSLERTLHVITSGLAEVEGCALARIWLEGPGDTCGTCRMQAECPDRARCLHLVASAGDASSPDAEGRPRTTSRFARFPIGARKVGTIAATAQPMLLKRLDEDAWIVDPGWAAEAHIQSFAGQPLVFRGQTLGVLAVFSRAELDETNLGWLRVFADHAAVAIANARAFDELETLRNRLELERDYLREENREAGAFGEIVGRSPALQQPLRHLERVAPTDAAVLVHGESGTGKELFARAVHERSDRRDHPLVRVNCAAVPKELFESEFFGHKRGAFTGATADRAGRFEIADGGTLFLDEVGEIPLDLQSKLLRVLQEGQFERIGEARTRTVDVRIVAATNRDLAREAADGRFREDLFYRLSVFPIRLPPLRERREDIAALADHFVDAAARRFKRPRPELPADQIAWLEAGDWPGNIRELQSVIDRAVILCDGSTLRFDEVLATPRPSPPTRAAPDAGPQKKVLTEAELRELERANLVAALDRCAWRVSGKEGAAQLLGIKGSTLTSRMRAFGIMRPS